MTETATTTLSSKGPGGPFPGEVRARLGLKAGTQFVVLGHRDVVIYLQEILGHAQLSATDIYTHVSIERLKAVHTRTHPAHRTHATASYLSSRADASAPSLLAAALAAEGESATTTTPDAEGAARSV